MKRPEFSHPELEEAMQKESERFREHCSWVIKHMPPSFFQELTTNQIVTLVRSLMSLDLQDFMSHIHFKDHALVLCFDTPDCDLQVLKEYHFHPILEYRTFISNAPPPFPMITSFLRVTFLRFSKEEEELGRVHTPAEKDELIELTEKRNPHIKAKDILACIEKISSRFLYTLSKDRQAVALDMLNRARFSDVCQYQVRYNEDWKEKKDVPSLQIVLAWKNAPKYQFFYRIAKAIYRHGLSLRKVSGTYVHHDGSHNTLVMSIGLHGKKGGAAWEEAKIEDFLQELTTIPYFEGMEIIETTFVDAGLLSGHMGNLVKSIASFVHQLLAPTDVNLYSFINIEEAVARHPDLVVLLCQIFAAKFDPNLHDLSKYKALRENFLSMVQQLDTGNEMNDIRRKNVLLLMLRFIDHTLKTNFYTDEKTGYCFRITPQILEDLPYDRKERFPELPFAIFFMKGRSYTGFHIRFKDLSRGGLRTIFPQRTEQMVAEKSYVFSECYSLAYTQHKKNKDIPEGGSKAVIFLDPYSSIEEDIYRKEIENTNMSKEEIDMKIDSFHKEQKLEYLYQSQRSFIENLLTIVNCFEDGSLRVGKIIDLWKHPEYIYLGPDENMHNSMIDWISHYSESHKYKPGRSFISSKPGAGINHKEYGVTSLGVTVYMEEILRFLGIDPHKDRFTIKLTGGPDGDVAGNQILNLKRYYSTTAKLLAITDVSGTIYDPQGLDLNILEQLFVEAKPIRFYPPDSLSDGGFLLDITSKKEQTSYNVQTLLWSKKKGILHEEWLSGSDMNHLFRSNIAKTKADIFIPAGGRPRTINEKNYQEYLDETGKPTMRAIVEGANLFLTSVARKALEKQGVLIIKDSSANKGGVICSSFEVLAGLILSEKEFLDMKTQLMKEILDVIKDRSRDEARLLLQSYQNGDGTLTELSEKISEKIRMFTDQLLDYFLSHILSQSYEDPLIRCLLHYFPPCLRTNYKERILKQIPDGHKKAIIACHIASKLVYKKGLSWQPTISDVMPLLAQDPDIIGK